MSWKYVMTNAKEEISTFNPHLQHKRALPVNNPQHNTQHHHKEGCYLFPINFYYYLLVTFTSGKNNMMTIQTKRKSSTVNKLFKISYIFLIWFLICKYFCTILAKVLKLHKARTHNSSWGGPLLMGGNGRHMVFEVWRLYFNSIICKYNLNFIYTTVLQILWSS